VAVTPRANRRLGHFRSKQRCAEASWLSGSSAKRSVSRGSRSRRWRRRLPASNVCVGRTRLAPIPAMHARPLAPASTAIACARPSNPSLSPAASRPTQPTCAAAFKAVSRTTILVVSTPGKATCAARLPRAAMLAASSDGKAKRIAPPLQRSASESRSSVCSSTAHTPMTRAQRTPRRRPLTT